MLYGDTKISRRGQITIPKYYREKLGLADGISIDVTERNGKLIISPVKTCHNCGKPLPDELIRRGACLDCPLPKVIVIY